jgi:hypothetical protein
MSTPPVVGTCQDCIISVPITTKSSMRLSVQVTMGNNLLLRNVGTYNQIYPNDQVLDTFVEIAASGNYSIPLGTQVFFLSVSAPVTVTAVINSMLYTFPVQSLLILDTPYSSLMVTNGSTTASVFAHMSYIPNLGTI